MGPVPCHLDCHLGAWLMPGPRSNQVFLVKGLSQLPRCVFRVYGLGTKAALFEQGHCRWGLRCVRVQLVMACDGLRCVPGTACDGL